MSNDPKAITFVSTLPPIGDRPGLSPVEGGHGVTPKWPLKLSTEDVQAKLKEAVGSITAFLNGLEDGKGPFKLDEAEMLFQIDQSGRVNIMVADVGGQVSGGIRFRWKRSEQT